MSDVHKQSQPFLEEETNALADSFFDLILDMFKYQYLHGTLDMQKLQKMVEARKEAQMNK